MKFDFVLKWFRTKPQPTKLTKEEIKELVSDIRRDYPDEVNQMLDRTESKKRDFIESKKRDLEDKKVIDVILQQGQSIAEKCTLNNTVRMRSLRVELDQAQIQELSQMAVIETALHESNKMIQNQSLKQLYSACQEMYMDFFEKLETHLDLLGEPPEDESAHPLQPYTLQISPAERGILVDSGEYMENLAQRSDILIEKMQQFFRTKAVSVIEYHFELLYIHSVTKLKKELSKNLPENETIIETVADIETNEKQATEKQFSLAQATLALMILDRIKPISKSQDKKALKNFIAYLTGFHEQNVGKAMAKFNQSNQFFTHKSKKQNLIDYEKVKTYFEEMENKEALKFIDNQINILNRLSE